MRKRKKRRVWVHDWLSERSRQSFGHYAVLMNQLREKDAPAFKNFTRMDPAFFDQMCQRLTPRLTKQDTNYRKAISPGLKLAVILRPGSLLRHNRGQYSTLACDFRVHKSTICLFITEVCRAAQNDLASRCMKRSFGSSWKHPHKKQ